MYPTLLSLDGRVALRATAALFGAAMLAACDSDRTVSPTSHTSAVPTTAASVRTLGPTGNLVIKIVDDEDHLLSGAAFKVTGPLASVITVTDNDPTDGDSRKGIILLAGLQPGLYTGCEVTPPDGYALPSWNCHSSDVYAGATTGMEKFVSNRLPKVQTGFVDVKGANVGGGTVSVRDSVGTLLMTVTDNGSLDKDPTNGRLTIVLPAAGKFGVCEIAFPAGFGPAPGSPMCHTVTAKWGMAYMTSSFLLYPAPSASWTVRDWLGNLLGPSTFTLTFGFITNTVVDNGANDLDPTLGRILLKLPKAAVYTLCETQPPAGYWKDPNCKTVDATSGFAVSAGIFTNQQAQVPSTP